MQCIHEPFFPDVCIYPWAGYDARSIFKQSTAGLNLEFSFYLTGCFTKVKEFSLPYYLLIALRENRWIHAFPKDISMKGNANSLIQALNLGCQFHLLWQWPLYYVHLKWCCVSLYISERTAVCKKYHIELRIVLSMSEYFKCIALIKILLWCIIFTRLWLHSWI